MKKATLLLLLFCISISSFGQNLPKGFVYLKDVDHTIQSEMRYISHNNFIGKPIDGYQKATIIVSKPAAIALKKVQQKLMQFNLSLKVFDAYRPQQAVDHFVRWAKRLNDTLMKQYYYPKVPKNQLFKLGYIASKSGHTRGSTVDLTIVDVTTGKELDMGSPYDFFGNTSHVIYKKLTEKQRANRLLLRSLMLSNGFNPYENEWWHFTLKNEPFPSTYFNFPIN
ncbi:D-alanyl-D-alanine dipeptidase [Polaribacter huanghezhanensis]|uniref:M15 family metallopeptidase n=1 Tax=Polaribacter huanghezhanensis TaxID=1354726 RepID=UPI0026494AD2|nr:M15 family metallopeptidase [Polaribacter huanghezhanensis]WKD86155.1 D-alanyl-D-alanine dipeptidase [Polaribacter huanghezhanensis]